MTASTTDPCLGLSSGWALGEYGWHTGMDANLLRLGLIGCHLAVLAKTNTPPASPAEGDRYLCDTAPTGAWSGHPNAVAIWYHGAWVFYAPSPGWLAVNLGTGMLAVADSGGVWRQVAAVLP
jgi:hypothetical protein